MNSAQAAEMEMDQVLAQKGYVISKHKVYNPGLPAGVLGKGNFGCVYKAGGHGLPWAIKKIESASTFDFLTQKEIEVLRLLNGHRNIVSLADTIAHPSRDWLFIVMEFVEGGDLLGALTKHPHIFDEALVRPMMFHISCGLAYAHEAGVLHRDLKPENILLRRDMVPKIADFGLARMVGNMEICQTMAGTPGYMAPEVMDMSVPYDFPADVFSLGLVFADMLSEASCLEWLIAAKPTVDKERFLKRWPAGASPGKKTAAVVGLQRKTACQIPGERITAYQLCMDLLELEKTDPMPCKLWLAGTTGLPQGPPSKRMVTPAGAAEIAGRLGYAKGVPVLVKVDGEMRGGVVEHISTTLCPGAAQVRYQADEGEKTVLVCPWQFTAMLRPALREALSVERSRITNAGEGEESGGASSTRASAQVKRRGTRQKSMEVRNSRCQTPGCCVQ